MADARQYRPGSRNPKFRKFNRGAYTEQRMAWLDTILGQIVLMFYAESPETEEEVKEKGPSVRILIPQYRARTVTWDLSHCTMEELDKLRTFFTLAFDTAEPVVRERDRKANEALAAGDDSFSRVYRRVPQLVVRPRQEPAHSQSVQHGHEDVLASDSDGGTYDDSSGRVRGTSGGLADTDTEASAAQDDDTQAD